MLFLSFTGTSERSISWLPWALIPEVSSTHLFQMAVGVYNFSESSGSWYTLLAGYNEPLLTIHVTFETSFCIFTFCWSVLDMCGLGAQNSSYSWANSFRHKIFSMGEKIFSKYSLHGRENGFLVNIKQRHNINAIILKYFPLFGKTNMIKENNYIQLIYTL